MLFGPAYKGIPLSVTTAIALSDEFDTDVRYCSNRKEVKDHGDVGILLGGPINDGDRVMMIEDVTTSGKSINETMPIIQAQGMLTVWREEQARRALLQSLRRSLASVSVRLLQCRK